MDKYDELLKKADNLEKKLNDFTKYNAFTLRDYFAGQALAGIMTNIKQDFGENPLQYIAKICYAYADALIKEREE